MKRLFWRKRALYLITDTSIAGLSHIEISKKALSEGIKTIQLREKKLSKEDIYIEAKAIRLLTKRYNAALIINDHIDIALAVGADGVHLGQDDMPINEARRIMGSRMAIGVSTHTVKQAVTAQNEGADYIGFGPLYHTTTKDAGRPKGLKGLHEIRGHIKIPIAAIGGITTETAFDVIKGGADAVAVGSAILSGDMKNNIKEILSVLKER